MSLLDRINKLNQPTAANERTEEVRGLQRAISGKQVDTSSQAVSGNLAEKLATQQAAKQESDTQQQFQDIEQVINQRAEAIAQQFDAAQIQQLEKGLNIKQQLTQRATELLNNAGRQGQQLDVQKQRAQMEQLGFTLRMNNDKYMRDLQDAGTRSRLDNDANFREEYQRSLWSNEMELFNSDLDFQRLIQAEGREVMEILNNMEIDKMIQLGETAASQASQQAIYNSLNSFVNVGGQSYATYAEKKAKKREEEGETP